MLGVLTAMVTLAAAMPYSYLLRAAEGLDRAKGDIPAMTRAAEAVAARIAVGGKLYAGGNPSLISEMSGRAGGLMLTAALPGALDTDKDAVMFFVDAEHPLPSTGVGACCVVFGGGESAAGISALPARDYGLSPTLTMAIQAWMFTGELIAACTRLGKMPVVYESIGLYGGIPRMQQYRDKGVLWHEPNPVPPIAPGVLATDYADRVAAMLRRCEAAHRADFDRAGAWVRAAVGAKHGLTMYSMGHLFPDEVGKTAIGTLFRSEVWNAGFSYIPGPEDAYAAGDLLIHIGYQHPPRLMLDRAKAAGARAVYVAPYMDRDFPNSDTVTWIDPMWPFADACVPVPDYDVPALAASGVINAAIAWELYRTAQVQPAPAGS